MVIYFEARVEIINQHVLNQIKFLELFLSRWDEESGRHTLRGTVPWVTVIRQPASLGALKYRSLSAISREIRGILINIYLSCWPFYLEKASLKSILNAEISWKPKTNFLPAWSFKSEDILCEMNLKPAHLVQVNVKASLDGFNQLHLRTHRSRYLSVRRQLATVKLRYLKRNCLLSPTWSWIGLIEKEIYTMSKY